MHARRLCRRLLRAGRELGRVLTPASHLPRRLPEIAHTFERSLAARARSRFIDPLKKTVGLTLRKELVSWGARGTGRVELGDLPRPGALFAEARVARVDPGMGLLLDLGAGEDGADARAPGYVHVSNCSDKHIDKLEKAFSVGQRVKARVLAQRAADGLASLSLREGVVSQALLSVRDCAAGMAVEGTVEAVQERGVVVRVTDSITGFCPLLHTSDAPNETGAASRARKFPEGKRMSWRVLVSDAATNKLVLTARRSLMGDAVEALVSLEGAVVGTRYAGVVANVQPFGVFVEFFGGVRGLAHRSQLGLLPSQEPAEVFERGAPVRAEVTGVDFDKRQLSISLSTTKRSAVAASEAASGLEDFEVGDIVDATVRAPLSRSAAATIALDVRHEGATDGDASVARATLSCAHACDVEEISAPALELLRAGDALGVPCVVLASDPARGVLRVSAKASLVGAARRGELPASGEELAALSEGTVLDAYVASVTPTAVFVRCGERTTGYVKSSRALAQGDVRMSERLELTEAYARDQSVLVRVIEAEADTNRFSGSLLRAAVAAAAPSRAATALASGVAWARRSQALALREKEEATRGAAAGGTKVTLSECCNLEERYCARFPLGKTFSGEVLDELDYGVVVKIAAAKEVLFFLGADATGGEGVPDKGKTVDVRVIDANVADGIVDVTCAKAAMPTKKSKKVRMRTLGVCVRGGGEVWGYGAESLVFVCGACAPSAPSQIENRTSIDRRSDEENKHTQNHSDINALEGPLRARATSPQGPRPHNDNPQQTIQTPTRQIERGEKTCSGTSASRVTPPTPPSFPPIITTFVSPRACAGGSACMRCANESDTFLRAVWERDAPRSRTRATRNALQCEELTAPLSLSLPLSLYLTRPHARRSHLFQSARSSRQPSWLRARTT